MHVDLAHASRNFHMLLVHVGKTAGGSIRKELEASGAQWHSIRQGDEHFDRKFEEIHMRRVEPMFVHGSSNIVISVRNPVDRFVSAYNWRHPQNGCGGPPYSCSKSAKYDEEQHFYRCFPSLHNVVNPWNVTFACMALWKRMLEKQPALEVGHVTRGFEFHLSLSSLRLPLPPPANITFHLVDTASYQQDMDCLFDHLHKRRKGEQHVHTKYNMYEQLNASERDVVKSWPFTKREQEWYAWLHQYRIPCTRRDVHSRATSSSARSKRHASVLSMVKAAVMRKSEKM